METRSAALNDGRVYVIFAGSEATRPIIEETLATKVIALSAYEKHHDRDITAGAVASSAKSEFELVKLAETWSPTE